MKYAKKGYISEKVAVMWNYPTRSSAVCRESDQTYMDKLFIPIQGCLLEVVRSNTDFYRDKNGGVICKN